MFSSLSLWEPSVRPDVKRSSSLPRGSYLYAGRAPLNFSPSRNQPTVSFVAHSRWSETQATHRFLS